MFAFLMLCQSNPAAVVLLLVGSITAALLAGGLRKTPPSHSKPPARTRATASTGSPRGTLTARGEGGRISTDGGDRSTGRRYPRNSSDAGRPRKNPIPDPNAPRRPRGRPRKTPAPAPAAPAAPAPELPSTPPVLTPEEFIRSLSA